MKQLADPSGGRQLSSNDTARNVPPVVRQGRPLSKSQRALKPCPGPHTASAGEGTVATVGSV